MARKPMGLPAGVKFAGQSIRIRFTWQGRKCETLPYPQTAKGIKAASDLRAQVVSLAKHGALDEKKYAELFPNSKIIGISNSLTFGEYAQTWLDGLEVVPGTRSNYLSTLNIYWMPSLSAIPMGSITTMILRKVISATPWKTTTIKRTAISRMKALMSSAVRDEVIKRNSAAVIQLPARNKKVIDPFTAAEADSITDWLYKNFTQPAAQIYAAYFEFAFYTGMRTGELLALRWDEIDLQKRTAHVCRIVVKGKIKERTKTKYARTVMLNSRAMHALTRAKEIADQRAGDRGRVKKSSPFVFQPSGGSDFMRGPSTPGGHFDKPLKALKIKLRSQYNCRHTYATMCLMAGMNPAFIAGQLGHSVQVLLSTYAKWLNSTTDWAEVGKLESKIGTKLVQNEI
ncbi:integrase [Pseudomonas sp. LAMO17WK12:I10]|uniref:site-specific integrase n=1 Tax=unclassified Pseudomonas TaxID=196821 RepID=UPI000BD2E9AA|nr:MULTISPECIES: site-specific integrase [unclassified Pseudomonas]PXX51546.1 integrase [Pseudomonas sp. LAMO17WK12:I9]SNY53809.1 integrase [Pseudomonas sp. LAMO17WK12:I10]